MWYFSFLEILLDSCFFPTNSNTWCECGCCWGQIKYTLKTAPWTYLEHKSIRTLSRWLYCSQRNTLSPLHLMLGLLMWNWLLLSIYDLLKMQACLYMHVTCWGEFKGKNVQVCVLSHFSHVWLCAAPECSPQCLPYNRHSNVLSDKYSMGSSYMPDTVVRP